MPAKIPASANHEPMNVEQAIAAFTALFDAINNRSLSPLNVPPDLMKEHRIAEIFTVLNQEEADSLSSKAQLSLAQCLLYGWGTDQNRSAGIETIQRLANDGDASAQCNLGMHYANGCGVEQDYEQAFECYKKAAQQGSTSAQYNISRCYAYGEGVEQDLEQARSILTEIISEHGKSALQQQFSISSGSDRELEIVKLAVGMLNKILHNKIPKQQAEGPKPSPGSY